MTQDVPTGAWMTMRPLAPVVLSRVMTSPLVELIVSPLMMVSGRKEFVVGSVQTMWKVAPASG